MLAAHEPDIFPKVPARVSLTLAGHTHGGQVALPVVGRMIVPSAYGQRYAYGHVVEDGRHLIVSGGLGCSMIPVRFGVPPEVVVIDLGGGGRPARRLSRALFLRNSGRKSGIHFSWNCLVQAIAI